MSLTKNKVYTVSAYVNTADATSVTGSGVFLKVTESGGTVHTGEAVDYITSEDIDEGWVRIALTFTAASSGTATVSIQATGMVGTFYADDVQLELGEAPSNYNILENGGFQVSGGYGWTNKENSTFITGIGVNSTATSAGAAKIAGDPEEDAARFSQTVNVTLPGTQTYVLSGWAKADAVPDNVQTRSSYTYDYSKQFGLRATITYTDESKDYYYVPFNPDVSGWQFASLTIIPTASLTVSTIQVFCAYEANANTAYFDNISLVLETAQSTTYDDNGNPTVSSTTGLNKQSVTYDSNGNVSKVVQKTGTGSSDKITTTYTYDSTFVHRMLTSSNGVVTQTLTHDAVGNVLTSTLKGTSGKSIVTSSAYTNGGNLVSSVTDSAGNTTRYDYYDYSFYKMLGQAKTVTDAKQSRTDYTLDSFGRIISIDVANAAELGYTYSNGMLDSLTRTAGSSVQTYDFTYDSFGNTTDISVGDSIALAAYVYGANNGLLTSQTYGNGDSVSFTYDALGRVKTTTYSDGRVLTYRYTGDGQLYSVHDSKTGYTYQYSYDTLGRLIASSVKNSSGDILTTRQTYDANNQLTAQSWQLGSTAYSEVYTYSTTTGLLATHTPAVGSKLTYGYDALQRLSTITGGIYGKTYTYRDVGDNTTTQVAGLTYDLPTDVTYGYTYDVLGNIATYTQGGTTYTYTYDTQNQLLKQTGGGKTYTYTYDAAGNILTSSDGTTSHSYTYGHAAWKDLLTAFDGETITYDGAGNPTSYYNGTRWTFGWQEGRRLVSATDGTTNLSFVYDSEGLRLSKTVGSTKHNYYYAGGKLMRETWGSNTLDFFYDSTGNPYAVKYNGTLYYYITNLQGDVLHITNSSGTTVVSYTYDPYGKPLTTTGTLASTLGSANPLRYRGYYFDSDSGLYYLQSRYYDPELCRFINADSYASTGQGILGCNMFAYCLNNPINFVDWAGSVSLWYYLIVDSDMGFIHRAVQAHIKLTYGVQTEVSLQTYGRADILNDKGEIWEIKHAGKEPEIRMAMANMQATTYVLLNEDVNCLGSAYAYTGSFYIGCEGNSYLVEYETPAPGVVLYTVSTIEGYSGEYAYVYSPVKNKNDVNQLGSGLVIGGALTLCGALLRNSYTSLDPQYCVAAMG